MDGERVWCLERTALIDPTDPPEYLRLRNPFDEPLSLRIRLRDPWRKLTIAFDRLPISSDELGAYAELVLAPGEESTLTAQR